MDPVQQELYQYYVGWFVFLLVALYIFRKATEKVTRIDSAKAPAVTVVTDEFRAFQRNFVLVYLIMMGGRACSTHAACSASHVLPGHRWAQRACGVRGRPATCG